MPKFEAENTARFIEELSGMAWSRVLAAHPDRSEELRQLWSEILRAADVVLSDPVLRLELIKRTNMHTDANRRASRSDLLYPVRVSRATR